MSSTALAHDAFAPRQPPGMRWGLVLAVLAHALLVAALAWSVSWKTSQPEGVVAELWSALPQIAAARANPSEPPIALVPVAKPLPPDPKPVPAPAPRIDPQIAVEQAKEQARREEADRERQRLADEQAEKKLLAEKARRDQAEQAAIREANLRRMMSQAGASDEPAASGNAARTSGPSSSYAGRIKAYIRPFIKTPGALAGTFRTEVEVRSSPEGTILSTRITRPSGSAVWDDTVLRALGSAGSLPRDTDGRVPSPMLLDFRSNE